MNNRVTHTQCAIEIAIDGRRYRAVTHVVFHGDEAALIDSCALHAMPPRLNGLIDRASAEDAEILG